MSVANSKEEQISVFLWQSVLLISNIKYIIASCVHWDTTEGKIHMTQN